MSVKATNGSGWFAVYKSEKIKYRHTIAGKLFFIAPVLTILLAYGLAMNYGLADGYNWWYMLLLNGTISLYACLAGQKDKKLKNRAVLSLGVEPGKVWDAKILTGISMIVRANMVLSVFSLTVGNVLLPAYWFPQEIQVSWAQGLAAMALMTLAAIWQVPFCLFLNQKIGFFPALLVNMALSVTGTIGAVESWWFICPYAIVSRLMCSVLGILPNGLIAKEGSMTFRPELLDKGSILPGVLISLLWLAVLWTAGRYWYRKKGVETV